MAYSFARRDRTLAEGTRRIAAELIDGAVAGLGDDDRALALRVHEARKAVKKLRGLIRLVRPGFPDYRAENAALGDCGRTIRALRDAEVMLAAFDRTAAAAAEAGAPSIGALSALRAPFEARKQAAEDPGALAASLSAFRDGLGAVRARLRDWEVKGKGFDAAEGGLARTLREAQKAMAAANDETDTEAVHTWRKRAKDRWYQARLLRVIWPDVMDAEIAAAETLGETLGDHNDLSVLLAHLDDDGATGPAADALRAAAAGRQAELLAAARPLSRRLLAGRPADLAHRWRLWWEIWRED